MSHPCLWAPALILPENCSASVSCKRHYFIDFKSLSQSGDHHTIISPENYKIKQNTLLKLLIPGIQVILLLTSLILHTFFLFILELFPYSSLLSLQTPTPSFRGSVLGLDPTPVSHLPAPFCSHSLFLDLIVPLKFQNVPNGHFLDFLHYSDFPVLLLPF